MLANTTSQSETLIHTAAASHLELNAAGASERFGLTHSNRRSWLARVIGGSTLLGCIGSWSPLVVAEEETSKRRGASSPSLQRFRVRSVVELKGEVHLKAQNAPSIQKDGKPSIARKAPVQSNTTLDYDEEFVLGDDDASTRGYQYFHEAKLTITVDRNATNTSLRESCREIVKVPTVHGLLPAGLSSPLFHAERDLIEGSIDSIYLDQILTEKEVSISDKWVMDRVAVARLFHLDAVLDGDVTICLVELDEEKAHLEVRGKLQATVRDVGTELEIKGKALMDRKDGYVSWFAAQIDETREIGEAEPGFKAAIQIRVLRSPLESMTSGRSLAQVWKDAPTPEGAEMLQFQSDLGFYRFLADRRWTTYRDNGEEATLRFIVSNRRVGQCNITNLVDLQPGEQLTLEGFQADIKRLAINTGRELMEASERLTRTSHRLLRVTLSGTIEGVEIRWMHYHISNDQGRRLSLVFIVDEASLDLFGEQDGQIIDSLELLPWPTKLES